MRSGVPQVPDRLLAVGDPHHAVSQATAVQVLLQQAGMPVVVLDQQNEASAPVVHDSPLGSAALNAS